MKLPSHYISLYNVINLSQWWSSYDSHVFQYSAYITGMNQKVHKFNKNKHFAAFVAKTNKTILNVPMTPFLQKLGYKTIDKAKIWNSGLRYKHCDSARIENWEITSHQQQDELCTSIQLLCFLVSAHVIRYCCGKWYEHLAQTRCFETVQGGGTKNKLFVSYIARSYWHKRWGTVYER